MENKFRNEMEIKLGPEKILLRPTFENIAATESNVGALQYLAVKSSRGIKDPKHGLSMSEIAQIIYYNQAATDPTDVNKKKYSLEQIWDLTMQEGLYLFQPILIFLARMTAGNKYANIEGLTEEEKKS